ncbi:MAG: ATP-binding protein [Bacteroidales bacterium]|nr:ATP-binding protein [Bacteroidales bacterium]
MIVEIKLSNFFSVMDEVVLDMRAANIQNKKSKELEENTFSYQKGRLLKTVAIYGANASGKSSIVKAIRACVGMIINSHNHNENTVFPFAPFKFGGADKLSSFFIRFNIDGVEYEYSFKMTQTQIVKEELYYYPNGRRSKVFRRDESLGPDKKKVYDFRDAIARPMDVVANTSLKTLFVSRASQMGREVAQKVFRFFYENFILDFYNYNPLLLGRLLEENKNQLLSVLHIADSDIVNVSSKHELKPYTTAVFDPLNNNTILSMDDIQKTQLIITTYHKNNPAVPFDFNTEESDGTQRLFFMMLTILDIVKNNKILLVDEIERSLHTRLVEYIISLFNRSGSAQLIYTTHNTYLLDNSKVRKDQVYFTNKRVDGSTDLYSLYDYKDFRDTMDLEKAYLQGRFDAIPYINDSLGF